MKVDSTSIKEVEYNKANKIITVTFWSGDKYNYFECGYQDYLDLTEAESVGRFFNQVIKKNHGCQKVTEFGPSAF